MQPNVLVLATVLAGFTGASSVAAQTPPSADQPAHKVFVLNGCLTSGPGAVDTFKLVGAVPVGQAPPERPGASSDTKGEYILVPVTGLAEQGIARAEMQMYIGRKVEVTVRPVEVAPGPSPSSASTAASTEKAAEPAPVRYTAVKIASAAGSCPRR
jgi:hypothetical protein